MEHAIHLYSCVMPWKFTRACMAIFTLSLLSPKPIYPLSSGSKWPCKKKKKIQVYSNQLNNSSEESFQEGNLGHEDSSLHLQTSQCRHPSGQFGCNMRESTLWGDFRENTAQQRLQIRAVVWEAKVESPICISLSLLRDAIYTRYCCSWTRWMESQVTRHNSKADNL